MPLPYCVTVLFEYFRARDKWHTLHDNQQQEGSGTYGGQNTARFNQSNGIINNTTNAATFRLPNSTYQPSNQQSFNSSAQYAQQHQQQQQFHADRTLPQHAIYNNAIRVSSPRLVDDLGNNEIQLCYLNSTYR